MSVTASTRAVLRDAAAAVLHGNDAGGWTKASLLPGTEILIEGYQAKDGANRANGRDITFKDGKKLFADNDAKQWAAWGIDYLKYDWNPRSKPAVDNATFKKQVADMAGVSRQAISAVESGVSDPSLRVAIALSRALGLTVEELFGTDDSVVPVAAREVAPLGGKGARVTLAPMWSFVGARLEPSACASVFTTMNSTPSSDISFIRLSSLESRQRKRTQPSSRASSRS